MSQIDPLEVELPEDDESDHNSVDETNDPRNNPNANKPIHSTSDIRSMICDSFSGNREELYDFIQNSEAAIDMCRGNQYNLILNYIVSKIKGPARAHIRDKEFNSWRELKEILIQAFSDIKDYSQLMQDLNSATQGRTESILSYHNRLQRLQTRLLNAVPLNSAKETPGRSAVIYELTLARFILYSNEHISSALRRSKPKTLAMALSEALAEEKYLQARGKIQINSFHNDKKYCKNCNKTTHSTRECFKNQNKSKSTDQNQSRNQNVNQASSSGNNKFCRYCKKQGHEIENCRKRAYNNNKKSQGQNSNSANSSADNSTNQTSVGHLNSNPSTGSVAQLDEI